MIGILRRPGPAWMLGLVAICGVVGSVAAFILTYDVPDIANQVVIADWRRNVSRSGADLAALGGFGVGLFLGAALVRAWRAIAGGVLGVACGSVLGGLLGMLVAQDPRGWPVGVIVGLVVCVSLGFLIGLGNDMGRRSAARVRLRAEERPPRDDRAPV